MVTRFCVRATNVYHYDLSVMAYLTARMDWTKTIVKNLVLVKNGGRQGIEQTAYILFVSIF